MLSILKKRKRKKYLFENISNKAYKDVKELINKYRFCVRND